MEKQAIEHLKKTFWMDALIVFYTKDGVFASEELTIDGCEMWDENKEHRESDVRWRLFSNRIYKRLEELR